MSNLILLVFFGVFTLSGFFSSVKSIRKIRAARKYKDALLEWVEPRRSGPGSDVYSWMATSAHWLSIILIGLAGVLWLVLHPQVEMYVLPVRDVLFTILGLSVLGGSLALTGFMWGSSLFGPIAELLGGASHYAVVEEGLLFSGRLFPWNAFSQFSLEAGENFVRVWSASFPATLCFTPRPPTAEIRAKLVEILRRHLPSAGFLPQSRLMRCAFPALMAAVCIPFVVLALLLLLVPSGIAVVANSFIIYTLMFLGGKLIMQGIYGGKDRPAVLEP